MMLQISENDNDVSVPVINVVPISNEFADFSTL